MTTSAVILLTATAAPAALVGLWEFNDSGNLGKATVGTDLTWTGSPTSATGVSGGDVFNQSVPLSLTVLAYQAVQVIRRKLKESGIHYSINLSHYLCSINLSHYLFVPLSLTVLAYQAVQVIRRKLKESGIHESWGGLREILGSQIRITATFEQRDGKTLHVRQASQPEEQLKNIYKKLGLALDPGGIKKLII